MPIMHIVNNHSSACGAWQRLHKCIMQGMVRELHNNVRDYDSFGMKHEILSLFNDFNNNFR